MDIILSFPLEDNKKILEMNRDEKRIKTWLPKSCDFDSDERHFGKIPPEQHLLHCSAFPFSPTGMNEKNVLAPLISDGFWYPDDSHVPDDLADFRLLRFFCKKDEVSIF
jgi:hypothetical protein